MGVTFYRDKLNLQAQIDNIWEWSERWGMSLHPTKTYVLHFGHGNGKYEYSINGNKIAEASNAKDLGVMGTRATSLQLTGRLKKSSSNLKKSIDEKSIKCKDILEIWKKTTTESVQKTQSPTFQGFYGRKAILTKELLMEKDQS